MTIVPGSERKSTRRNSSVLGNLGMPPPAFSWTPVEFAGASRWFSLAPSPSSVCACHRWTSPWRLPMRERFRPAKLRWVSCAVATNWSWRHPAECICRSVPADANGKWIYLAKRRDRSRSTWCIWPAMNCIGTAEIVRDIPKRIRGTRWMQNRRATVAVHYHPETIYRGVRLRGGLSCHSGANWLASHQPFGEFPIARECIERTWCRVRRDGCGFHCSWIAWVRYLKFAPNIGAPAILCVVRRSVRRTVAQCQPDAIAAAKTRKNKSSETPNDLSNVDRAIGDAEIQRNYLIWLRRAQVGIAHDRCAAIFRWLLAQRSRLPLDGAFHWMRW